MHAGQGNIQGLADQGTMPPESYFQLAAGVSPVVIYPVAGGLST